MRETPTQTSITEIFRYTDPTLTYVLHTDLTTIIIIDHNHFVVFLTLRQTLLPTGQWNTATPVWCTCRTIVTGMSTSQAAKEETYLI